MLSKKQIEESVCEAMRAENKAYCVDSNVTYSLEQAKKQHDQVAKDIMQRCNIKKAENVLDVGCGFGDLILSLSKHTTKAHGLDIDKAFISLAREKAKYSKNKNTTFVHSAGEKLPFGESGFDLVVSKTVLEHVSNVKKSIAEMVRVTKNGGKIYIECPNYFWIKEDHYNVYMLPLMPKWLFKIWLRICGKNPKFLDHINYTTPNSLTKELRANNITVRNVSEELIRDILKGNTQHIAKTRPFIAKLLRVTYILQLNLLIRGLLKIMPLYPFIILVGEKQ